MAYTNEKAGIAYYPVHKCANTTMKRALYLLEAETSPLGVDAAVAVPDSVRKIHRDFPGEFSYRFDPVDPEKRESFYKFAIVRDPVSRIQSMFQDKILGTPELRRGRVAEELEKLGLPKKPSFLEFLENIKLYRRISKRVRIHTFPLKRYLGKDPGYFDRLYAITEVDLILEDLSKITGVTMAKSRANASPKKARIVPSKEEIRIIESLFKADYDQYGRYFKPAHH